MRLLITSLFFCSQKTTFTVNKNKKLGAVSDFYQDSKVLELAGISIGEEESYIISKSLIVSLER